MKKRTPLSEPIRSLDPQPPISADLRNAVIAALRCAWSLLHKEKGVDPMLHDEEEITAALWALLNEKRNGCRRMQPLRLFKDVVRSGQYRAAQGSFKQQPDLRFQPRAEPRQVTDLGAWALFAECKIVGPASHHSPTMYCQNGVDRFASGKYAPRMSTGVVVAYVRDGQLPFPTLKPLLAGAYGNSTLRPHKTDARMIFSMHDRTALIPSCVSIEITHVWLDARPAHSDH